MASEFLKQRKEKLARVPNPCPAEITFNGSKGQFWLYDPSIEEKDKRRTQIKSKAIRLVILGLAKRFKYIQGAKGNAKAVNVSSNYFQDYNTDTIQVWDNGEVACAGLYEDIKDEIRDLNAKVQDCYFALLDRGEKEAALPVVFVAPGGKKSIMRKAWKKVGGYAAEPYIELSAGKKVEGASFDYIEINFSILDVEAMSEALIAQVDEVGPNVIMYLADNIKRAKAGDVDAPFEDKMSTQSDQDMGEDEDDDFDDNDGLDV